MDDKKPVEEPRAGRRRLRPDPELWAKLKPLAQEHRREATKAEDKLWQSLRASRVDGVKFRRQHSIDRHIVDFYCPSAGLVIELDGPIHERQVEEDRLRQEALEALGLKVIRFTNVEVLEDFQSTLLRIREAIEFK